MANSLFPSTSGGTTQTQILKPPASTGLGLNKGTGLGLFGQQQQVQQHVDPLLQRLYKIRDSYDPNSTQYRFRAIVYNAKGTGGIGGGIGGGAPKGIDPTEWQQAIHASPDEATLTPSALSGFNDLKNRINAQQGVLDMMKTKLNDMITRIMELNANYLDSTQDQLKKLTENNNTISYLLMKRLQTEEVNSLQSHQFSNEEHNLLTKIEGLKREVDQPNKFSAALNDLRTMANLNSDRKSIAPQIHIHEATLEKTKEVLDANGKSLKSLIDIVKKIDKTTDAFVQTLKQNESIYK